MASRNRSRYVMKENRIPIGKKKENLEKKREILLPIGNELEKFENEVPLKKNTSRTNKKLNKVETNVFITGNINKAPTDTSLSKSIKEPRPKLSTIKELEERASNSNVKNKINSDQVKINDILLKNNDNLAEGSKILVEKLQEETKSTEELFYSVANIVPNEIPDEKVVLSPFVCTTRGKKWVPTPRKSKKLSDLYVKYDDDNMADAYRKKLDEKTIELQNKVKYWTELASESDVNIPEAIKDEIDVACGQTKLLTTDKFIQMRTLIEQFDNKVGPMPITTTDLDGFWDMLLLQVEKLEGQFSQLEILRNNNWAAIEPIAKKVLLNKVSKLRKGPEVKSKFADFIKNQKVKMKTATLKNDSVTKKESENHFNKMELPNNTCFLSSTPTSSNQKVSSFSPMLLKTLELSFVARRSGMTPLVLNEPHESPLKPALKKSEQEKGTKRKNIHFGTPTYAGFISHENVQNDNSPHKKSNIKNRIVTPYTIKTLKVNKNDVPQNNSTFATKCIQSDVKTKTNVGTKLVCEKNVKNITNPQKTVVSIEPQKRVASNSADIDLNVKSQKITTKANEKISAVDTPMNKSSSLRRSSRLANKPMKNYKV